MTASHKDLLFTTFEEFNTAQRQANKARSDMHCIIATLPDEEKPAAADALPMPHRNRPIVACDQRGENNEKQMSYVLSEYSARRRNRPVIIVPPNVTETESVINAEPSVKPLSTPTSGETPKKVRQKRVSEANIRKAIKLVYDENVTQKEAEKLCNLPIGTLSRRKGKEIMAQYRKNWGTPTTIDAQRGASRKELENAFLYGDDR